MLLGAVIFVSPYLLFFMGGGGDTSRFDETGILTVSVVVAAIGLIVFVLGIVLATITERKLAALAGTHPEATPADPAPVYIPGKTLGAVALVLSLLLSVVGLVLGYVARSQSRRAGAPNRLAATAITIGWITTALTLLFGLLVGGIAVIAMIVSASYVSG